MRLFNTKNGKATDFILENVEFDNSESKKGEFFEQLKNFFLNNDDLVVLIGLK